MDLKIRTTLIFVFLFFFIVNPVLGQDRKYVIQFGTFLIEDNAKKLKKDIREVVPEAHVIKIDKGENHILYSVRTGPFAQNGDAESKLDELKKKDALLEAVIVEEESVPKESEFEEEGEKPISAKTAVVVEPQAEAPVISSEAEGTSEFIAPEEQALDEMDSQGWDDPEEQSVWGENEPDPEPAAEGSTSMETQGESMVPPQSIQGIETEIEKLKEQMKALMDAEEVRGELKENKDEKKDRDEDILEAAGRNYTLMKTGGFGLEYKFDYTYNAFDSIAENNIIEHNSNHTLTNTFTVEYPKMDNLTLEAAIPFVYEYDAVGADDSKHVTDFGDVSFGASFQPLKAGGKIPSMIINTTLTCPMGRSPYEVNPDLDLSTGSGGYALSGSLSLSKAIDPIMAFGTLSYTYRFPIKDLDYKIGSYTLERYDRGDSLGFSVGLGYSVSYITSVTLGYSYSYSFESTRYYKEAGAQQYQTQTSSSLSIGSSWRLSNKLRVNLSLALGLGNNEYFSLSMRLPMEFGRD